MPVNSSRVVLKTALLAPGGVLIAAGLQTALAGDALFGGVVTVAGIALIGGFVLLEEYDLPYETEIVSLIESQVDEGDDPEEIADRVIAMLEDVDERREEFTDSRSED